MAAGTHRPSLRGIRVAHWTSSEILLPILFCALPSRQYATQISGGVTIYSVDRWLKGGSMHAAVGEIFIRAWVGLFNCAAMGEYQYSCKESLIQGPVSDSNKTHWFTKMDLDGIVTFVGHGCPTWGEQVSIPISPGKVHLTMTQRELESVHPQPPSHRQLRAPPCQGIKVNSQLPASI